MWFPRTPSRAYVSSPPHSHLQLRNEFVRVLLLVARAQLHRHTQRGAVQHGLETALQFVGSRQQRGSGSHLFQNIDGTAGIQVNEVGAEIPTHQLADVAELLGTRSRQLDSEALLRGVATQQGPLAGLRTQQVAAHGHFAAGDVGSHLHADPTERQVADRGQRSNVDLAVEVDGTRLPFSKGPERVVAMKHVGLLSELHGEVAGLVPLRSKRTRARTSSMGICSDSGFLTSLRSSDT